MDACKIGMNLAGLSYWSTQFPFIDRMKNAGAWAAQGQNIPPIPLDADGYPLAIPAGADNVYCMVGLDPLSAGTGDTYALTYTGTALFELLGGAVESREPGRIVFRYTNADSNQMPMKVSGLDPASPLIALSIVRLDQEELFRAGEIFNPAFLDKISAFDTLRYMDWMNTNDFGSGAWGERTRLSALSWAQRSGTPIDVIVALANRTRTNIWICVPTRADDAYVRSLMTYVRDHLGPGLTVEVEYSNEVWNWGFQQSHYSHVEAAKLWGKDANGDGKVDPNDPAEQVGSGWVDYYGYRAAQVAAIAREVFGADPRLRVVLATQTAYIGLEGYIFDGVARAGVGSAAELFDEYAITTYFGGLDGGDADGRAKVLAMARGGADGMTAAFTAVAASLVALLPTYASQAAVAARHGLELVAYEGGVGLEAPHYTREEQAEVMAFYKRLNLDPRMGDMYRQMIADFSAAGGTRLNAFNDVGADSPWGTWGALKSIYDQGSPAWDALVAAAAETEGDGAPAPAPIPAPAPVPAPPAPPAPPLPPAPIPAPSVPKPSGERPKPTKEQIYAAIRTVDTGLSQVRQLVEDYRK